MKPMKKRLLSLLLTLVTILSLLPTSAFAASKTGSGIQITQDQAYWSTRLLANGTPYSYRPPLADGKLVYCMDSGLGYHYATKSFLDSYSWTSGSGADADAVLQSALTNSGLSEMDAMTVENVKWMMTYLNDCKDSNVGQLFMAVQTYVWENQSYKGEPGGDGDAGGYANADTYELYLSLIDNLLAKKAAEDAEFLKQIEAYKAQGIEASIVEDESAKWAVFAISSNRKNQSFFNYYGPRKLSVGEAKPDQPEQPVGGTGKITLTKTAAGTLKGLPGARYSIYFNGQIVGSDVTNESGELHIENAATGLWTFIETDAPSGFCVDPTPKSVYVDASEGDREYTVAAVNYAMPSMILYKEDAQTSAPVPGTVLSVKSVTGAYSTSVKIGESGSATLEGLEPGVYVVSEESVPEPYILSHTEQTVALRPGKTTEVHFQNYKKPGLEILKKNIANMDPIPDMTYKVEQIDGSFETTVTTDLRGRAYLENIPVGSYRISEVGGPSNVILSEIPQVIYLEAGCTRTVTFFNAIKPTLTVLKQNSVTSDPLPGAKLHIYYASDNTSTGEMHDLGVFYSNEEGKVVLVDAERGWYKIVEESCPQGFGYGCGIALYYSGRENRRPGEEYGSAKWGDPKELNRKYMNHQHKEANIILTQHVRLGMDGYITQRNMNILVVGGSGSGKTRFFCKPGVYSANCSYLITDPKGELLRASGGLLKNKGYDVKVFNLIDPSQSDCYNPFVYVHNEKDVLTLIDNLIKNTTPRNASSNDPFWEKAEIALDSALMLYLISEAPSEERNFETMLYMMNFAEVREDDDQYRSPLDMLFRALEEEQPNHVAVKQYKVFKQAAGDICSK